MGMPTVGVYVLLAALVAPAMVKIGLSPMASHMFVMYFGMMSMITPPVALAAYAAASLAGTDPMKTGWTAVRFGWIAYIIPFLFVRSPSLLLDGTLTSVLMAVDHRADRRVADLRGLCRLRHAPAQHADAHRLWPRRPAAVHPGRRHAARRMDRYRRPRARRHPAGARNLGGAHAAAGRLSRQRAGIANIGA